MTDPAKDAERLAEYRLWYDTTKPGTPCYASIGFLLEQIDRLTQERDAAMESLLSSMRHNSIATGHGDSIADLIGEYNAWAVETRVLLQRTLVERDEACRSAEAKDAELDRLAAAYIKLQGDYNVATAPPNPMDVAQPTTDDACPDCGGPTDDNGDCAFIRDDRERNANYPDPGPALKRALQRSTRAVDAPTPDDVEQSNETAPADSSLGNSGDPVAVPDRDGCACSGEVGPASADDVERARVPTLLQRAEQLWDDLQKDELGGFSGINRPFWIVQAFKEVDAVARREGAELRALDEAVIVAARVVVDNTPIGRFTYLRDALAARDAAIGAREGEE